MIHQTVYCIIARTPFGVCNILKWGFLYIMNAKNCGNCINFRLHYIKYSRGNYRALSYGHCVKPRLKKRYAEDNACAYWQEKGATQ